MLIAFVDFVKPFFSPGVLCIFFQVEILGPSSQLNQRSSNAFEPYSSPSSSLTQRWERRLHQRSERKKDKKKWRGNYKKPSSEMPESSTIGRGFSDYNANTDYSALLASFHSTGFQGILLPALY
jgi:hypothetical protein